MKTEEKGKIKAENSKIPKIESSRAKAMEDLKGRSVFLFKNKRGFAFWSASLALFLAGVFLPYHQVVEVRLQKEEVYGQTVSNLPVVPDLRPVKKPQTPPFETETQIAYAFDLQTGTLLYQKNADKPWPTASLAKLMTALVAVNTVALETPIIIGEGISGLAQPVMGLQAGEEIRAIDLLRGMLIPSANDAAYALAMGIASTTDQFVALMNSMAKKIGLDSTHFRNPAGFDDPEQYSTAEDLARLTLEFLNYPLLSQTVQTQNAVAASTDGKLRHWLKNSNRLLAEKSVLGVKTGYTEKALGNLIILSEDAGKHQVLTVVLGSSDRENDSRRLIDWVFSSYRFPD